MNKQLHQRSGRLVPDQRQAAQALAEVVTVFAGRVDDALLNVDAMLAAYPDIAINLDTSTRASMVNNHATALIEAEYLDDRYMKVTRRGRMVLFTTKEYRLRVKKLDQSLRGQNFTTAQQARLYRQIGLPMDGNPDEITDLIFGYRLSDTLLLDSMWVVCPKNMESNHWVIPVFEAASDSSINLWSDLGVTEAEIPVVVPRSASVQRSLKNG